VTNHPHPLGRNKEHDPASRAYQVAHKLLVKHNVTHLVGPHLDQADLGSCEGNTANEWLNWNKALPNRIRFNNTIRRPGSSRLRTTEEQAVLLYGKATHLDNDQIPGYYPPTDTGTSAVGVAKAMQFYAAIDGYDWTFDFESFLGQLQKTPVMLGTNWYAGMFEINAQGFVAPSPSDQDPDGGHAYLAHALDYAHERVGCTNHWVNDDGTPWGVRIGNHDGSFWIKMGMLEQLLIHEQGESMVPRLLAAV
jgi:hypothetical protein